MLFLGNYSQVWRQLVLVSIYISTYYIFALLIGWKRAKAGFKSLFKGLIKLW
jgi:hypothetical protein